MSYKKNLRVLDVPRRSLRLAGSDPEPIPVPQPKKFDYSKIEAAKQYARDEMVKRLNERLAKF